MKALALVIALTACGQYHVRLDAPRPGITPQERVALFWARRPTEEAYVKENGSLVNRTLFLGDRQSGEQIEVVSPEDLEPLVGADSETMRYARASISARRKARVTFWTGLALAVAGFVASGAFADEPPLGLPTGWIGGGVMVAGLVLAYPVARHYTHQELALRKQAFDVYPRDLGLRLDVCAHGTQVVPCEAPLDEPPSDEPREKLPPATTVPARTALLRMR